MAAESVAAVLNKSHIHFFAECFAKKYEISAERAACRSYRQQRRIIEQLFFPYIATRISCVWCNILCNFFALHIARLSTAKLSAALSVVLHAAMFCVVTSAPPYRHRYESHRAMRPDACGKARCKAGVPAHLR